MYTRPTAIRELILYPLVLGIVLGTGFFAGRAWNASRPEPAVQTVGQTPQAADPATDLSSSKTPGGQRQIAPREDLSSVESATVELFQSASPSVVFITSIAQVRDFWTMNVSKVPSGTGSGFVWDREGHIITNYHVIQNAREWQVTLEDQSTWEARLVGIAPEKDLAVLRVEAPADSLSPMRVGRSENLLVGQSVYAIGNPFGLDFTLTTGVISALGREIDSADSASGAQLRGVIQTDTAINPGNSGGPLLDSSGRLIGINTAIYSPSGAYAGVGFAIPVDTVNWVVADLIRFGRIQRPALGVELYAITINRRLRFDGAMIQHVYPGSGAEVAGLRAPTQDRRGRVRLGDIIVAVDGAKVDTPGAMFQILESKQAGDVVRVRFVRDGREQEVDVRLQAPTQ